MSAEIRFFDEDESGESTRAQDMLMPPNWLGTALIETREPSEFIWVWDGYLEDYVLTLKEDLDAAQ